VIFQSVEIRNHADVLIHLVAERSRIEPAIVPNTGPTVSGQSHEGAATVQVISGRSGWSFTATVTGDGAAQLPLDQARRWVLTAPLPT
jgi:hypothetical protein